MRTALFVCCYARSKVRLILALALIAFAGLLHLAPAAAEQGMLQTIREDVHPTASPEASGPPDRSRHASSPEAPNSADGFFDALCAPAYSAAGYGTWYVISMPFAGPRSVLDDHDLLSASFPRYPYEKAFGGYIHLGDQPEYCRLWAARLDVEHVETFDELDQFTGHLLVSTMSRFGLDASFQRLEERLSDGNRDRLWLGDANLVFRFAQAANAEFRAGVGLNWIDEGDRLDLGFNFTYAADFFPRRPWVVSTSLDAGTLGHAGLFRFRTTGGLVFHGVELYTGYEFTQIGHSSWNGWLTGLRVWF